MISISNVLSHILTEGKKIIKHVIRVISNSNIVSLFHFIVQNIEGQEAKLFAKGPPIVDLW